MFKECTAKLPFCADLRLGSLARMRKPGATLSRMLVAALLSIPLVLTGGHNEALAKNAAQAACSAKLGQCLRKCNGYVDLQIKNSCIARCMTGFDKCWVAGATNGKKDGADAAPPKPRATDNSTPPTGGTKADPKKPPKVTDTRPPLGGGVFGSKTQPTTGGTSGPILKSNGGNGPSFRSSNGQR